LFKTVIVGDSSVGKTQMLSRFVDNEFSTNSKPTIGVEFGTKTIAVGKSLVKNQIWDTAGQDKYKALTCSYYRGAVGAIVVFDLSRAITFEHVQTWINEVR
jgi:Ras-related protein Rab-11A